MILAKNKYQKYLKSDDWAAIRCDLISMYNSTCQCCLEKTKKPQIHHLTYDNIFCEKPCDLILLCPGCHQKIHGIKPIQSKITLQYAREIIIGTFGLSKKGKKGWGSLATALAKQIGKKHRFNKKYGKIFVKGYLLRNVG